MQWALFACFALVFAGQAQAQEICNNGIDDDNDGYVDCFDDECSGAFFCFTNYFGSPVPGCQVAPPTAPPFAMQLAWQTNVSTFPMDNRQTPIIADIDLDGVPEVIGAQANTFSGMYIFDGATGNQERTLATPPQDLLSDAVAVADIDNDGFGEIILTTNQTLGRQMYCYEHNGGLKWTSSVPVGYSTADAGWTPAIADFNGDGTPEVYLGNQIFNALTGVIITNGGAGNSKGASPAFPNEPFSIAADVLPDGQCADCSGLELIAGDVVYSVNITTGTVAIQTSFAVGNDGPTSLADIDMDGDMDAVVSSTNGTGRGVIYAWDLQTSTGISNIFQVDNASAALANSFGISQATIADFDGNGDPEVLVSGRDVLAAVNYVAGNFVELWSIPVNNPGLRGGSSAFDFEADGNMEVVHRDADTLYVINAANGSKHISSPCPSFTGYDAPVIADVDADGQANIVCACDEAFFAFEPSTVAWADTRHMWNQHSYLSVNINDNLSVPREQQEHHLGYPIGTPVNFPFNAFMKQSGFLAANGLPENPAPDDVIFIANPNNDVDMSRCQNGTNNQVGLAPTVMNLGDANIPAATPVTFYTGNPTLPGATVIATLTTGGAIAPSGTFQFPMTYVPDGGGSVDIYFVVNDDGTGAIPIPGPANTHDECDLTNNMDFFTVALCGNTPPVVDTSGIPTNQINVTSNEDTPVIVCISATDAQNDEHDAVATIGTLTLGTITGLGDGDSCVTLTPQPNITGNDQITVIVCDDAQFPLCDTVVINWTIIPGNDPPVALDDTVMTMEDVPVTYAVQDNDFDAESNPLVTTILSGPSNGTATVVNDSIQYTPAPEFSGMDTIFYEVCDNAIPPGCDTAMMIITVTLVNDIPVAGNDSISIFNDSASVTVPVLLNDMDIENDPLSITLCGGPQNGTATVVGTDIVFVPDSTFLGFDTICYILCDNFVPPGCDTAYVFIDQQNSNIGPMAMDDGDTTTLDDTLWINVLVNDTDPNGNPITVTGIPCQPVNGTATIDANNNIVYVPNTSFLGMDSLCYVICDNPPAGPLICDTAWVTLTVFPDNQAPIAMDDMITTGFNGSGNVDVLANDSDPDGDAISVTNILQMPSNGTFLQNGGMITYTPNLDYFGPDTICYEVCDNAIPSYCDTACIYILVDPNSGLSVPNGFSPNGDQINDLLEIEGISLFPSNRFMVFNRWGGMIFEANGYDNTWDGSYKDGMIPDGTYFYTLDLGDGSEVMTGYIVVYR